MVDPLRNVRGVLRIPVRGFACVNGCGWRNNSFDEGEAILAGAAYAASRVMRGMSGRRFNREGSSSEIKARK